MPPVPVVPSPKRLTFTRPEILTLCGLLSIGSREGLLFRVNIKDIQRAIRMDLLFAPRLTPDEVKVALNKLQSKGLVFSENFEPNRYRVRIVKAEFLS